MIGLWTVFLNALKMKKTKSAGFIILYGKDQNYKVRLR